MQKTPYSPGILAKKMGVNVATVKRHLKDTGLIKQCCGRFRRFVDNTAIKMIMVGGEFLRVLRLNFVQRKLWLFR